MASYNEVLNNLTAGEEQNVSRQIQYDNIAQQEREKASYEKLKAAAMFSKSLDNYVTSKVDEQIEDDKERGKLLAIEKDFETQESIGSPTIEPEDEQEYYDNKKTVLDNKKLLNETANEVVEQGGSYQDANDVSNLSGWALYSYVQQKSKIAADNYEDWLKGEMKNNETLELEYNGVTFTPSTAETITQKQIALKALRRQYVIDNELLDVNRSLLNDKDVGFYDKVNQAHKTLSKEYETEKDIDDGIRIRQDAIDQFIVNKDFALLLGEIKRTVKPDGTGYNRKEALDETFKILKDLALTNDISLEELKELQEQEVTINGETYKAGRWRKRWAQLAIDITQAKEDAMESEQDEFEMQGDKYIMDIQAKERELQKDGKKFSEKEIDEMIANWNPQWGKVDTYLTDLKTRSSEDEMDDIIIDTFNERIKNKQPIYQTDVDKIQDITKWKEWSKIAKEEGNAALIKKETDLRDSAIRGEIVNNFFANVEKPSGSKWEANNAQATARYNDLYYAMKDDYPNFQKTHDAVMKILSKEIAAGDFNEWEWAKKENQADDKAYKYDKQSAVLAIKADPSILKNGIIPGTEDALKLYIESDGKIVPKIYEDLVVLYNKENKPPISASKLANDQAAVAGNDVENIKSQIDIETEKLPNWVQEILLKHPDQYKVQRAKIEMLKLDGDISYNDVEYLVEEAWEVVMPTPQLKKAEPRIGDWKELPGLLRIGYAVWDGEEWIFKNQKGKFRNEWGGEVDNYRDLDGYFKPFKGSDNSLKTTFYNVKDETINESDEIKVGEWYKVTNRPTKTPFVVWDGKKWTPSAKKGRFSTEYKGEKPLSKIEEEKKLIKSL